MITACAFRELSRYRIDHRGRIKQPRVVRENDFSAIIDRSHLAQQRFVIHVPFALSPFVPARFQNPEPHDVLQKSERSERAAFVSEVAFGDVTIYEWAAALDPYERPGTGRDVGPIVFERRTGDRAG